MSEPVKVFNEKGIHTGTWVNGRFIPTASFESVLQYGQNVESKVSELEREAKQPMFSWIDYVGLSIVAVILAGTSWAVIDAVQQEQKAADAAKVEVPMPQGYRYIDMPGGQPDVITFCDLGNRIYRDAQDFRGETIAVIPNDPSCS